jgi:hypothetical protein
MMNLYLACRDCLCCVSLEVTNRSEIGQLLLESGSRGADVLKILPDLAPLKSFFQAHAGHRTELAGEDDTLDYRHDSRVLPAAEELSETLKSGHKDERLVAAQLGRSRPECASDLARAVQKDRSKPVQEAAAQSLLHLAEFEKLSEPTPLLEPLLGRMEKADPPQALGELLALLFGRDPDAASQAAERLSQLLGKNPEAVLKALAVLPMPELIPQVSNLLPNLQAVHTLCAWAKTGVQLSGIDVDLVEQAMATADLNSRHFWLDLLAFTGPEGRRRVMKYWLYGDPLSIRWCENAYCRAVGPWQNLPFTKTDCPATDVTLPAAIEANWQVEEISHGRWVTALAFSKDGSLLATGAEDGTVKLWDRSGKSTDGMAQHEGPVSTLDFSPNGQWLASAGWDGRISIQDLHQDKLQSTRYHNGFVVQCRFLDDGRLLTTDLRQVALWSTEPLLGYQSEHTSLQPPGSATVSKDGDFLLLAGGSRAELREAESGERMGALFGPPGQGGLSPLSAVSFSPDGFHAVGGQWSGKVCVWKNLHHEASPVWEAHDGPVRSVAWGRLIVTTGNDRRVCFWNETGELIDETVMKAPGLTIAIHPSSDFLAVGHASGEVLLLSWPP